MLASVLVSVSLLSLLFFGLRAVLRHIHRASIAVDVSSSVSFQQYKRKDLKLFAPPGSTGSDAWLYDLRDLPAPEGNKPLRKVNQETFQDAAQASWQREAQFDPGMCGVGVSIDQFTSQESFVSQDSAFLAHVFSMITASTRFFPSEPYSDNAEPHGDDENDSDIDVFTFAVTGGAGALGAKWCEFCFPWGKGSVCSMFQGLSRQQRAMVGGIGTAKAS
jgi:hypothetical protein